MDQQEMIALVEQHLKAEGAGDVEGAVAVYTDDIVHDGGSMPGSPRAGKDAAREFYRYLTANFRTESEEPLNRFFDGDTTASGTQNDPGLWPLAARKQPDLCLALTVCD